MSVAENIPDYCMWSAISMAIYYALEFYVTRRQIAALKRNEMPKNISLIQDKWDVKIEEIKKANEYNAEKM